MFVGGMALCNQLINTRSTTNDEMRLETCGRGSCYHAGLDAAAGADNDRAIGADVSIGVICHMTNVASS